MQIKDLELSHELSRDEQAAVHGGNVVGANAGLILMGPVSQTGGSGFSAFSPVTNVNVQAPTLVQTNVGLDNDLQQVVQTINDNDVGTIVGSLVNQFQM
jgi:hypothetical protein